MSIYGFPRGTLLISSMEYNNKGTDVAYISADIHTIFYHKEKGEYYLNISSHACLVPIWPFIIPIFRTGTKKYDYDLEFNALDSVICILPGPQAKILEKHEDEFNSWVYLKRDFGVKGPQIFLSDEQIARIDDEIENENSTKDGVILPKLTPNDFDEKEQLSKDLMFMTDDDIKQKLIELDRNPRKNEEAINYVLEEISRRSKNNSTIKK